MQVQHLALHRSPQQSHSVPESPVQTLPELWQAWGGGQRKDIFCWQRKSSDPFLSCFLLYLMIFHLCKAHILFLGRNNTSILRCLIIAAVFMRGQHHWETKSRVPVTSMEHWSPRFSYAAVWNLPIPNACDSWQHCLISEPSLSELHVWITCLNYMHCNIFFPVYFSPRELFKCNGCRAGFPSSALITFASLCLIHQVSQSKDKPWAKWAALTFGGMSATADSL